MSIQQQVVPVNQSQGSNAKRNETKNPISRVMRMTLAFTAAVALMGCAFDGTSGEPEGADVGATESTGTATESVILDTDSVKVTGSKVDFGGEYFALGEPTGSGTMTWSIVSGFYTPRLTGYLHMNNAAGKYARMHISYWDGGGGHISTRHGGAVQASGNGHQYWSVDLSPSTLAQIVEAHVCTELSDDGVNFPQVSCETYILY